MVTLNPIKWQLPSFLSIARVAFSAVMLMFFIAGMGGLFRGAFVVQTAFAILVPLAWFGLMFRSRIGDLL